MGSFGGSFCFFSFASLLLSKPIPYISTCGQVCALEAIAMQLLALVSLIFVVIAADALQLLSAHGAHRRG